MKANKPVLPLLILSVVGSVIGYVLTNSIKFGVCIANETVTEASCINFTSD